jgi:ribonuclease HII
MAVLVGIDEAGFGPILGPLVVSSSAFSLGRDLLKSDLWQVLRRSVGSRRRGLGGRLLITDSKKAFSRSAGIGGLERTVLASLRCAGGEPATLGELLSLLCPDCFERLRDYPWYEGCDGLRLSANAADGKIASSVLRDDLAANGMELLELRSYCFDVAHYNKMVGNVKNKASVLFTATAGLIDRAFRTLDEDDLQIVVDRQGGRVHYRKVLRRMFDDLELTILCENPSLSSYELTGRGKRMRIHFSVGADGRYLPVSLSSMVSKYVRELLVGRINAYFAGFDATLKPTAGYWKDGQRFIKDLKSTLPHVRIDDNQLIRCR